jgi:hypothetical protein
MFILGVAFLSAGLGLFFVGLKFLTDLSGRQLSTAAYEQFDRFLYKRLIWLFGEKGETYVGIEVVQKAT